jgi:dienelactone hydrolase
MELKGDALYQESAGAANNRREKQLEQLNQYIERARQQADMNRQQYFKPDLSSTKAYEETIHTYRRSFNHMLGWPLMGYNEDEELPTPLVEIEFVATDQLSHIYRLEIEADAHLSLYGILFIPLGQGPFPLVIVQHGGSGTPELCAGFYGPSNYNDMVRRILRRGCAVFAPQLHLWSLEQGPTKDRKLVDNQLKQLGSSISSVEIFKLRRGLDYLQTRPDINKEKMGMAGLSYGGFYTLFTAAADVRIKAAYSSCFFNNRFVYDRSDWIWKNSGNTFLDAEIAGLICPRPLYIEVGLEDELFEATYAGGEADKVKRLYEQLRIPHQFQYHEFQGKHEFNKADAGIDFLCGFLG